MNDSDLVRRLDSRTWMYWACAASLPVILSRNPFVVIPVLVIALTTRSVWIPYEQAGRSYSATLKLAALLVGLGIVFNVLTVRAGERVLAHIPGWIPLLDGQITWNAVVFGLLSGLAALTLILIWITVSEQVNWVDLLRSTPESLVTLATTATVAITFLPQTLGAFREIREAQAMRGHQLRGIRDLLPIAGPLLGNSLDRAANLAETLEVRGFGQHAVAQQSNSRVRLNSVLLVATLTTLFLALFLLAVGREQYAVISGLVAAMAAFGLSLVRPRRVAVRTRYRSPSLGAADMAVLACSGLAFVVTFVCWVLRPELLRYEPYPTLTWPVASIPLMIALLGLFAPALCAQRVVFSRAPERVVV